MAESDVSCSTAEQKCPICLEDYEDKSYIDACFHGFCFICIVQWSEVTNSCPLCKATFENLIHDIKSNNDYKIHKVSLPSESKKKEQEVSINEARRFRYRTTATCRQGDHVRTLTHNVKQSRKPASEGQRRTVYLCGLRNHSLTTDAKKTRIRDISAKFFKKNPAAAHRLLPWLSRDIKVTLGEEHIEFIIQLILSLIDKIDIESREFRDHLQPFFHEITDHFIHEFISFAQSPLDMIAYDNLVSYGLPQKKSSRTQRGSSEEEEFNNNGGPLQLPNSDEIQQRVFHEVATCSRYDSSPLLHGINVSPSPHSPEENESNTEAEFIRENVSFKKFCNESIMDETKTIEKKSPHSVIEVKAESSLYQKSSRLFSSRKSFDELSEDTSVISLKHKTRKHLMQGNTYSCKQKNNSKHRSSDCYERKRYKEIQDDQLTKNDLSSVSNDFINSQLQCVDSDLIKTKRKLLKQLLKEEKTLLLKKAIYKETGGDNLMSHITEIHQSSSTNDENVDRLLQELQDIKKAIDDGKRKVLAVEKRLSQEFDSDESI